MRIHFWKLDQHWVNGDVIIQILSDERKPQSSVSPSIICGSKFIDVKDSHRSSMFDLLGAASSSISADDRFNWKITEVNIGVDRKKVLILERKENEGVLLMEDLDNWNRFQHINDNIREIVCIKRWVSL